MLVGIEPQHQELTVYASNESGAARVASLQPDDVLLSSFALADGMRLHVHDRSGRQGAASLFEDLSAVPK